MRDLSHIARPSAPVALLAMALSLAACTTTSTPAPQAAAAAQEQRGVQITRPGFQLPTGTGCAADVARFRAIIRNDLETNHTTKSVHDQIMVEMDRADAMCAAGNSGGGSALVRSTRLRFGYPGG